VGPGSRVHGRSDGTDREGTAMQAQVGDRLIVKGHRIHEADRDAEILEVRGPDGTPPYRIRWSDSDHDTLLYPGPDARIEHRVHPVHRETLAGVEALGLPARDAAGAPTLSTEEVIELLRRHIDLEKLRTVDYDTDLWSLWREEVARASTHDVNTDVLDRVLARVRVGD
jgi:hypothetical protein